MEFIDLQEQYQRYKAEIDSAIADVLNTSRFIGGPVIAAFEKELAEHAGAAHAIGCSSGTDALVLGLLAYDIQPGDEIIVPDFTFIATAEVVSLVGAVPVFADVMEGSLNIDPESVAKRVTSRTRGIIPVSLYGQCADFDEINSIAKEHGLWVMEDAAQSYGATYKGKQSCALTETATTSFFPAKPLGCYGDGGAVFTSNDELATSIRMLLNHGQEKRYHHAIVGMNARLDALQAAILRVKLRHFDEEMERKQEVAGWYTERLKNVVSVPAIHEHNRSVWAQYTVRTEHRDDVIAHLSSKNVPTAIHYPMPLHRQKAFASLASAGETFPASDRAAAEVFSLPMHPFLREEDVDRVCGAIREAL